MGVLDFIFGLICLLVLFVMGLGYITFKFDNKKLEEENTKLKEDLKKARTRKLKNEYKKAKEVSK